MQLSLYSRVPSSQSYELNQASALCTLRGRNPPSRKAPSSSNVAVSHSVGLKVQLRACKPHLSATVCALMSFFSRLSPVADAVE